MSMSMEDLLKRWEDPAQNFRLLLADLVALIRTPYPGRGEEATRAIYALCYLLSQHADFRARLRASLMRAFAELEQVSMYASTGILPNTGFFSEIARRVSHKILPEVVDPARMKDLLTQLFDRSSDAVWVSLVADDAWIDLLKALRFDEDPPSEEIPPAVVQVTRALRVLSYHIAAIGLEPELVRLEPRIEDVESPFLALNTESLTYLTGCERRWRDSEATCDDDRHLGVLLDQCGTVIQRIHRRATHGGTSIRLTFVLQRLQQHLERFSQLLAVLESARKHRPGQDDYAPMVTLFKTLVQAECGKNDLGQHWNQSVGLLALRVTENTSRVGEHYIATTRFEYFEMWRSALGAGFVIAVMAMLKLMIGNQSLPPLTNALLICLNYGLGFVFIHFLGFTVATKQPAMTAATIAASIGDGRGRQRDLENLTTLIAQMVRSQMAAILGNVSIAIPMSILLGFVVSLVMRSPFISVDEAHYLMNGINPLYSGAIAYAAIAGVCLFLSGLIAGYYDNLGAYNKIPGRLLQLKWLRRVLGAVRQRQFVDYVENNLGALAGNFYFGFMLGGVTAIGTLFGLPLDIRHIAFSSAYVGYALVAFNFHMTWKMVAWAVAGIAAIGVTNLAVSFALALTIALRARQVSFAQWRSLVASLFRRLFRYPREFFLPPKGASLTANPAEPAEPAELTEVNPPRHPELPQ